MVQIYMYEGEGELRVDVKGHGDLENIQKLDVMCAAVTTLTNSLALMVLTFEESGMLEEKATVYVGDDGEGKARTLAKPKPEFHPYVKTAFETVSAGYLYLATMYPEYVEFIRE